MTDGGGKLRINREKKPESEWAGAYLNYCWFGCFGFFLFKMGQFLQDSGGAGAVGLGSRVPAAPKGGRRQEHPSQLVTQPC